jgi:tRNA(fMet)-specific endonuclease VapC
LTASYLLDTNILSDLVRNPAGAATRRIRLLGEDAICTSIIVAAEMRFGCAKRNSPTLTQRVENLLIAIPIIPFEPPADRHYGKIRAALEVSGQSIGHNDLLIAAHALALDSIFVTANDREFRRINGLNVENWLEL